MRPTFRQGRVLFGRGFFVRCPDAPAFRVTFLETGVGVAYF